MLETIITHRDDPRTRIPEPTLTLVRHANEFLKEQIGPSDLPYRAVWTVQPEPDRGVSLALSCLGGSRVVDFTEAQLRDDERLWWPVRKLIMDVLGGATETLARDMRRKIAAIEVGDD